MTVRAQTKTLLYWLLFSIAVSILFRIPSAIQDGLSERAAGVGWLAWHTLGWLARDVWQAIFVLYCAWRALKKTQIIGHAAIWYLALSLALNAILTFFLHDYFYGWAVENRGLFGW